MCHGVKNVVHCLYELILYALIGVSLRKSLKEKEIWKPLNQFTKNEVLMKKKTEVKVISN